MKVKSYQDMSVRQIAIELVVECYRVTDAFPRSEEFGLKSQICRAAISIPSNVADGNVRHLSNEYCRHLAIALGSTAELETQIELARRLGLELDGDALQLTGQCKEVGRLLNGLRCSIAHHQLTNSA